MKSIIFLLVAMLVFTFAACDSMEPTLPALAAPAQLRAASDSGALILAWSPSTDEGHSEFSGYHVTVTDTRTEAIQHFDAGRDSTYRLTGLENGVLYRLAVRCWGKGGLSSPQERSILWSPAQRRAHDAAGQPIRVYAVTASGYPSAVDILNPEGRVEALLLNSPAFRERASLYVHTLGSAAALIIRSPELAFDPGPRTRFADWVNGGYVMEANSLNEPLASSPPDTSAYTATYITLPNGTYPKGRVYFGKLLRPGGDIYFRMLVKRNAYGRMAQGTGDKRYIEIEVSVQSVAGNHFAKRG
jgi:hypothetical protein